MNGFARYLIIIPLLGPAVGCQKKPTPVMPEPLAVTIIEESVRAPSAITPSEPTGYIQPETAVPQEIFMEAEQNFVEGNYRQAAKAFENFLRFFPKAPASDRALFHLGFSLALSGDDLDLLQTEATLRRLIAEFPRSPYRRQAEWILSLMARIEKLQSDASDHNERIRQLSNELNRLRSIDFDRRPSRPE